jgi:hypothetical protein
MALSATSAHFLHFIRFQEYMFRNLALQVSHEPLNVFAMKSGIKREYVTVAVRAGHIAVSGRVPI